MMAFSKRSPYVNMIQQINNTILDMLHDGTLDNIWSNYHPNQKMPVPEYLRKKPYLDQMRAEKHINRYGVRP